MVLGKVPGQSWSRDWGTGGDSCPPGAMHSCPCSGEAAAPGDKPSKHLFGVPLQGMEPGLGTVLSMLASKAESYNEPWLTWL